ncbi:MAG: DUF2157 domain-containing protein [Thermoanaerobaculia bacterium]
MRSPEVAAAIPKLVESGDLSPATAAPLLRAARGELLSIRGELRAILYVGVLALVGGISLLIQENLDRIGPVTIAAGLAVAALGCLGWVLHRSPPFSWKLAASEDWSLDYLLLLGILLCGADLAYIEAKFTPLGDAWSYHLLLMSLLTGGLALRCDSRTAWSLALSTFAAWRGVAAARVFGELAGIWNSPLRWNLVACGAIFLTVGAAMRRFDRKQHFEPLTTFLGALALLTGLGLAALDSRGPWMLWALAFCALAVIIAAAALRARRLMVFGLGVLAGYAGVTRLVFELMGPANFGCFWFAGSSVAMVLLLWFVQRRFRAEAE